MIGQLGKEAILGFGRWQGIGLSHLDKGFIKAAILTDCLGRGPSQSLEWVQVFIVPTEAYGDILDVYIRFVSVIQCENYCVNEWVG